LATFIGPELMQKTCHELPPYREDLTLENAIAPRSRKTRGDMGTENMNLLAFILWVSKEA
jgi:hypothetical protein